MHGTETGILGARRLLIVETDQAAAAELRIAVGCPLTEAFPDLQHGTSGIVDLFGAPFAHPRLPAIRCDVHADGPSALRDLRDALGDGWCHDMAIVGTDAAGPGGGLALAGQLRLLDPGLPVILLGGPGAPHPADIASLLPTAPVYLLEKPVRPRELLQLVLATGRAAASRPASAPRVPTDPLPVIRFDPAGRVCASGPSVAALIPGLDPVPGASYAEVCQAVARAGIVGPRLREPDHGRPPCRDRSRRVLRLDCGRSLLLVEEWVDGLCVAVMLADITGLSDEQTRADDPTSPARARPGRRVERGSAQPARARVREAAPA